jgi:ribosomal-protein-alanine N-acetyltransferase
MMLSIEKEVAEQGLDSIMMQTHAENNEAITFFKKNGYSIHWLSVAYNPKLDRDVPSVGLSKPVSSHGNGPYGAF